MDAGTVIEALLKHPQALAGFVAIGAGVGAVVYDIRLHMKVAATRHWLAAQGVIQEGRVRRHGSGSSFQSPESHSAGVFAAHIVYEYPVGGVKHRGDVIAPGGVVSTSLREHAERWLAEYPVGSRVTVYYNPQNPAESCLRREKHGTLLTMGAACMFLGIGVWLAVTSRA
ncbi:MAG: DUF3592 domain-containing protein [Phycisphaeraceae bacterium]|nr:DUF3592 domain-containing protein [Phycisphaeraceae bacterium]